MKGLPSKQRPRKVLITESYESQRSSGQPRRRYQDIYRVDLKTGERKLALKKVRWFEGASPDASHLLYFDDGNFFSYDMASGSSRNLTKALPTSFIDTEDDHNIVKRPTRSFGW